MLAHTEAMTRTKLDALPLVQWQYPGQAVQASSRLNVARADELVFELGSRRPQPRVWLDGEVMHPGQGFADKARPLPR